MPGSYDMADRFIDDFVFENQILPKRFGSVIGSRINGFL